MTSIRTPTVEFEPSSADRFSLSSPLLMSSSSKPLTPSGRRVWRAWCRRGDSKGRVLSSVASCCLVLSRTGLRRSSCCLVLSCTVSCWGVRYLFVSCFLGAPCTYIEQTHLQRLFQPVSSGYRLLSSGTTRRDARRPCVTRVGFRRVSMAWPFAGSRFLHILRETLGAQNRIGLATVREHWRGNRRPLWS